MSQGRDFDDPLRGPGESSRFWTTVNAAEALPGVPTPMNWSWYDEGTESALLRGMASMGIRPRRATTGSPVRDERHLGIFHGHAAINVDLWRRMADAVPGTSGAAFERDILGAVRPGHVTRPARRRYPVVATKAPGAVRRAARTIRDDTPESKRWWRDAVARAQGADEAGARQAFARAFERYEEVAAPHLIATMAAQGLYDQLKRLGDGVGLPGHEARLTTGLGTEEGAILEALWGSARTGTPAITAFLEEYGYQGPKAGELSRRSWREDPSLLDSALETYRGLAEDQGPAAIHARQDADRLAAERELLARLSRLRRGPARLLLRLARVYLPLRESGRAGVLRAVDAGRAAARAYADRAHPAGALHEPGDVFMVTVAEMTGRAAMPGPDELVFRRERHAGYHEVEVPDVWQGVPEVRVIEDAAHDDDTALTGMGANPGIAEGRVRVVTDPAREDMDPGEILVCHTTDPSWASLFLIAAAVVIDIGGPISHGAIVARELGIPCVINTKDGTRRLRTGETVRVDGHAGTVERIAGDSA